MNALSDAEHLDKLVDRQIRSYEMRARASRQTVDSAAQARAPDTQGPWVAVSRQVGSEGVAIAQRAGEVLGWHVFDKEILQTIARRTQTREKLLASLDEHAHGMFEEVVARLIPGALSPSDFEREMAQVIYALARHGGAILVGRGANWLLDPRFGLRVRIVAPRALRASRVAVAEGISLARAEKRIREDDEDRAAFIRQVYRCDIDDPVGYDLVLNTESLDAAAASDVVLAALEKKLHVRP